MDEPLSIGERHMAGEIFEKDTHKSGFEEAVESFVLSLIDKMAERGKLLNIQPIRIKKLNDIMSTLRS